MPLTGSAERLQQLKEGYYGLVTVCLVNAVLLGALAGATLVTGRSTTTILGIGYIATSIIVGRLAYPSNKKIGEGADWSTFEIVLACVAVSVGMIFFVVGGYVLIQTIAARKIREFGVRAISKKSIERRIAGLMAEQGNYGR